MLDLVGNPEDWFSQNEAQFMNVLSRKTKFYINVKLVLISDTYCILIFAYP